jgi:hypothetical protein
MERPYNETTYDRWDILGMPVSREGLMYHAPTP